MIKPTIKCHNKLILYCDFEFEAAERLIDELLDAGCGGVILNNPTVFWRTKKKGNRVTGVGTLTTYLKEDQRTEDILALFERACRQQELKIMSYEKNGSLTVWPLLPDSTIFKLMEKE